jgi:pimeloyl-ACP methyl ester carboxylesterase
VTGGGADAGARVVRVNDNHIRVSVRGEGRPVLLINGLGGSVSMLEPLREDLSDFEVISFDAPGAGRSPSPNRPYTIRTLACLVVGLLDELGYEQVDVVGYSFGGVVAQQLARDHPQRVRRLVLGATLCGWGGLPGEIVALMSVLTPVRYYSRLAYALTAPMLAGGEGEASPGFIERTAAARVSAPPSVRGYVLQLMAAWTWSSLPWLHELEHPTLVVTGAEDRLLPAANSELIASRLPCGRLLQVEAWGHYLLLDRDSGAGIAIADFLRGERFDESDAWRRAREVSHDEASAAARAHRNLLTAVYWPHAIYRWRHTRERARPAHPRDR